MTVVSRPNRPARVVLTPAAKQLLTTAEKDGDRYLIDMMHAGWIESLPELLRLDLAVPTRSILYTGKCYKLTENGLRMRSYLQHQFHLGELAEQVKAEGIDGEDLADLAAEIDRRIAALAEGDDADIFADPIIGVSIDFQMAFALTASLSDQSAEDLRQDLETYLGWRD